MGDVAATWLVDLAARINPDAIVVAAALILGAEGVLIGTAFHVTTEFVGDG